MAYRREDSFAKHVKHVAPIHGTDPKAPGRHHTAKLGLDLEVIERSAEASCGQTGEQSSCKAAFKWGLGFVRLCGLRCSGSRLPWFPARRLGRC